MLKSILSIFVLGTSLVGCQSTIPGTKAASAGLVSNQAVTCSKCEVTWTKVPDTGGKGRIVGYTSRKQMECPDCKGAVENFFASGKLEHACKTCGPDTMQMCEKH